MQFNIKPEGTPVVIDTAASHTPLQWIEMKTTSFEKFEVKEHHASLLTSLTSGTGRLWVAGFGITLAFLGIVITPSKKTPNSSTKRRNEQLNSVVRLQ